MQIYNGPIRRVLRKLKNNTESGFIVDGIVDQEEERGIFVKQKFTLKQYENRVTAANLRTMSDQWIFLEEADIRSSS